MKSSEGLLAESTRINKNQTGRVSAKPEKMTWGVILCRYRANIEEVSVLIARTENAIDAIDVPITYKVGTKVLP